MSYQCLGSIGGRLLGNNPKLKAAPIIETNQRLNIYFGGLEPSLSQNICNKSELRRFCALMLFLLLKTKQ